MRERLAFVLLAVLLGAGAALAQQEATQVVPAVPVPEAEYAQESAPAPGYMEVSSNPVTLSEQGLRATVDRGVMRPPRGYTPLEVRLHNPGSTPQPARVSFVESGLALASREVEVGPRESLVTWLHVPVSARSGRVLLEGPGLESRSTNLYLADAEGRAVLVLGSEQSFQSGTGLPREEQQAMLAVRFVPPVEAPGELAAYVGHGAVVVAADPASVPAGTWAALEAYAATGGSLALLRPPRDVGERLPLLAGTTSGVHPYGFGQVRLCEAADECGRALLAEASGVGTTEALLAVKPAGPAPSWERNQLLHAGASPLLPGVQAPVGRFLFLITLFVLAVGPGGLALARRRGPVALLIAVPSVSLVTCLAIIGWSVLVDGFATHASRYSLTWLDRERDRAVTVGVAGYYANLAPEGMRVPALGALLGSDLDWDSRLLEVDWTNGMAVRGGFLRPRAYREWGEVAVVPTRARLAVEREGDGLRVRNALGAPLSEGYVRLDGQVWVVPALADGADGVATASPVSASEFDFSDLYVSGNLFDPVRARFEREWFEFGQEIPEGGFLVKLGGLGLGPTAALPVELHEGVHLVRGRVDGP